MQNLMQPPNQIHIGTITLHCWYMYGFGSLSDFLALWTKSLLFNCYPQQAARHECFKFLGG